MDKKLNIGVIGLGLIGSLHARILHELPNANLVGVADVDEARARDYGKAFSCDAYRDYQDLLNRPDLDAVSICVPEEYHVPPAVAAAKAGKHILIEKPIAKTVREAREIESAVKAAGVRLMVAHVLRFDPRYVQLHDAIARGDLGEPISLRVKRNNPVMSAQRLKGRVSLLYFLGVHDIDLIRWYAGADVTQVYAQKVSKLNAPIGCEDSVIAVFNFANGAIGSVELSWALPNNIPSGIYSVAEVVGTKGAGYVNIFDQGLQLYPSESAATFPDTLHWPEINNVIVGDLRDELAHFVQKTLDGGEYAMPTEDAIKAVAAIEACFESINSGMPVKVKY
ncbi:MAG TPA: Gfo/Idh/MocA family oxidoreductase [Firmicutes bacterium]|nr:Gfo/Idh/MocA family oxidoreductase [Bacillota bacterium]